MTNAEQVSEPVQITVIICTYNRAQCLPGMLESVVAQNLSQLVTWEVLIVDNNSRDETRQVVEHFQSRYPKRIRYLFESLQGLAHARNTGIKNARGCILAFIDDDETANPDWLSALTANLVDSTWVGAGGRVVPRWDSPRPRWLSARSSFLMGPLVMFDPNIEGTELAEPPFGANMAFRKEAFDKYGYFRKDLGRVGSGMLSGEDTEFGRRVITGGGKLRYEASAITYHPVGHERLTKRYFRRWWFNKGRSDVRESGSQMRYINLFGFPLRLLRYAAIEAIRGIITVDTSKRFICELKIWTYAGQAFEHRQRRLGAKWKSKDSKSPVNCTETYSEIPKV